MAGKLYFSFTLTLVTTGIHELHRILVVWNLNLKS